TRRENAAAAGIASALEVAVAEGESVDAERAEARVLEHAIVRAPVDRQRVGTGTDDREIALREFDGAALQCDRAARELAQIDDVAGQRLLRAVAQTSRTAVGAARDLTRRADALHFEGADVGLHADDAR